MMVIWGEVKILVPKEKDRQGRFETNLDQTELRQLKKQMKEIIAANPEDWTGWGVGGLNRKIYVHTEEDIHRLIETREDDNVNKGKEGNEGSHGMDLNQGP